MYSNGLKFLEVVFWIGNSEAFFSTGSFHCVFFWFSDSTIWGYRFQPVGAGPSQVDEVVLGHDIDCSTELTQLLLEGAAGIKSIGQTARVEARRHIPGGGDSQVDELIWGSDVDGSADPRIMEAKAQLFQGAAGGALQCKQPGRDTDVYINVYININIYIYINIIYIYIC